MNEEGSEVRWIRGVVRAVPKCRLGYTRSGKVAHLVGASNPLATRTASMPHGSILYSPPVSMVSPCPPAWPTALHDATAVAYYYLLVVLLLWILFWIKAWGKQA
eukprot:scaffold178827_cov49-Attheya_sp.AAC.1